MGLFSLYRHHLANKAHRRFLENNPSSREIAKAKKRSEYARIGRPTSRFRSHDEQEWDDYVARFLGPCQDERNQQRDVFLPMLDTATVYGDPAKIKRYQSMIARTERPLTWEVLAEYVRRQGFRALKPPRSLNLDGCSLAGRATTGRSAGTASDNRSAS